MDTLVITGAGTYDPEFCPKFLTEEDMISTGTLLYFDASDLSAIPGNGDLLPNRANSQAMSILGADGSPVFVDTLAPTHRSIERSPMGGLHAACAATVPANNEVAIRWATAMRNYIHSNSETHDYYFARWTRNTRNPTGVGAPSSFCNTSAGTSNYLWFDQRTGETINPSAAPHRIGSTEIAREQLGEPSMISIGVRGWTGTREADPVSNMNNLFRLGGSGLALPSQESASTPSRMVYLLIFEDLTVSGRTFEEVDEMVQMFFERAFAEGGRFHGDTWTDPAVQFPAI